jgi:hypothetical protein
MTPSILKSFLGILFMFCLWGDLPTFASHLEEWQDESLYKNKTVNLSGKISKKQKEDYEFIANQIKSNKIEELDFSSNEIEEEDIEILAVSLMNHPTLKKLAFHDSLDSLKAMIVLNALLETSDITDLDLSHNKITGWGIININEFLKKSQKLENLDLSFNPIEEKISLQIREGLSENNSLRSLKLKSIGLNGIGLSEIIEGLSNHRNLTHLDISDNPFGDEGAISIKLLLSENEGLQHIDLTQCGIGNFGLKKLAEGLIENPSFKEINLSRNSFDGEGKRVFQGIVHKVSHIKIIEDQESSFKVGTTGNVNLQDSSSLEESVNPYQSKMESLKEALDKGQIEAVVTLVEFYKTVGSELRKYFSEDYIQGIHDKAGKILVNYHSLSSGSKLQERKMDLPSNEEFYGVLDIVLQ